MFWHKLILFATTALGVSAQGHRLYVCGAASKGYVVGMKLPPSGLFAFAADAWKQVGFNHPYIVNLDYDRGDPRTIYLAAGNGCIRSRDSGKTWRVMTSWDMTELQDVAVDPHRPGTVFIALPDGIARSADDGLTWVRMQSGLERKFTKAIRVDRARARHVIAGTESGIFESLDAGATWSGTRGAGAMITHLEQSPHDPLAWMAATQSSGVFRSGDGARTWERVEGLPADETYYQVSFDPAEKGRIAVCGWKRGVRVSEDGGVTFAGRQAGLPSAHTWSVRFDPDHASRLLAGIHEEAVYVSDDAGRHWKPLGLGGWIVNNFVFVPESRR